MAAPDEKKGGLGLLILGKGKGPESAPEDDKPAPGDLEELEMVGADLLAAVKADDPKAVAEALRAAHEVCARSEYEEA